MVLLLSTGPFVRLAASRAHSDGARVRRAPLDRGRQPSCRARQGGRARSPTTCGRWCSVHFVKATVLPVASRALVESCRRLGLDGDALLAAAGIPRDALEDPDARLESERADALWRAAYEASGDPLLALRASEATPFGSYRVIDYLGVTGPTLGEGLRRVAAFFPIVDPRGVLRVVDEPRGVALLFTAAGGGAL